MNENTAYMLNRTVYGNYSYWLEPVTPKAVDASKLLELIDGQPKDAELSIEVVDKSTEVIVINMELEVGFEAVYDIIDNITVEQFKNNI